METVTNNLSKEQLLDYVKKQKLKLKKLEKDIETLKKENDSLVQAQKQNVASTSNDGSSASGGSSKEAIDPMLFWPMIMRQSPYVQSLAKCALNSFVSACTNTIMASNDANKNKVCIGGPHRSLRNGFRKWKIAAMEMRADAAKQAVESLESKYAQSEQKIAKLKVLLSKVNQANQRNMENTNAYKKAGEDVQMELYALKQKENSEKQSLMEALRVQSMESAFQYDTELTIQRAAEAMIHQQQQAHSSAANQTKKVKDFEDEKSQLVEQIKSLEQKREDMLRLQQSVQDKLDAATRKIAQLESQLRDSKAVSEQLLFKLKEEEEQREEVELELKATLNSRTTMLQEVEAAAEARATLAGNELKKQLAELALRLEKAERDTRVAQGEKDTVVGELQKANRFAVDLSNSRDEVRRLEKTNTELKRQLATMMSKTIQAPTAAAPQQQSAAAATQQESGHTHKPPMVPVAPLPPAVILTPEEGESLTTTIRQFSQFITVLLGYVDDSTNRSLRAAVSVCSQFHHLLHREGAFTDKQANLIVTFIKATLADVDSIFEAMTSSFGQEVGAVPEVGGRVKNNDSTTANIFAKLDSKIQQESDKVCS
jgi:hypothetical protein